VHLRAQFLRHSPSVLFTTAFGMNRVAHTLCQFTVTLNGDRTKRRGLDILTAAAWVQFRVQLRQWKP
jgi:hypothetical protein